MVFELCCACMSKQRREQHIMATAPSRSRSSQPSATAEGVEPGPFGIKVMRIAGSVATNAGPVRPTLDGTASQYAVLHSSGRWARARGAVLHQRRWPPGRAGPRAGQAASTAPSRASTASRSLASWLAAADTALTSSSRWSTPFTADGYEIDAAVLEAHFDRLIRERAPG
jgi:hypothetical protein